MQIQFSPASQTLYFTYYGLDPTNNYKPAHADASGNLVANLPSAKPSDALSHPAPFTGINFPMLSAARLYVSIGAPVLFIVDPAGNAIPPQPPDPTDPNYQTRWDFFEVTYIPQAGTDGLFNFNLSDVQSANLPLTFHVTGADPSNKKPVDYLRGWPSGSFSKFLSYLAANADFRQLVLPGTQRVLAPGTAIKAFEQHVISAPLMASDYLKPYIDQVWAKFAGVDLTFIGDPPPNSNQFVTWVGRVGNGQFTFTTTDLPGLVPIVLNPPSTSDLFENNFNFCASGGGTPGSLQENYALQIFGTFCAAFNRSMMLTTTTLANSSDCQWCRAQKNFYQDPITNHYSKAIHANAIDGLAYAFQSDDHCDVSSYVSVINPSTLTI
ncbi:MAG TPA: beta-1,3-glucanase family protein, partial [Candidatus Solibacter sp.]|nr:beta-1,3-glucanase family protein [Candidatus Solibacter sp.]